MSFDSLPVIIVTAQTKHEALELISEMIEEDVTSQVRPAEHESADRVWRLENKYYTACVRVHARGEAEPPRAHAGPVTAHVALLSARELAAAAAARRLDAPAWHGSPAAVNVLACAAGAVPAPLLALCSARRLEPVALLAAPGEGPCAEAGGVAGLRAALHAHVWPGLRRRDELHPPPDAHFASYRDDGGSSGSSCGEEDGEEGWEEESVERFARAVSALGAGARHAAALPAASAERRAAAEQLVAAFAAALRRAD